MDLVEAFRTLQPIGPHLPAAQQRAAQESARVLYGLLARLAQRELRRSDFGDDERDSVVSTVLFRMVSQGPRGAREGDPSDADGVTGWLCTAIRNAGRDLQRARRNHRSLDAQDQDGRTLGERVTADDRAGDDAHYESAAANRREAAVRQAGRVLHAVVIPRAVQSKERKSQGAGERLHVTLVELRAAAMDERDVQELAEAEMKAAGEKIEPRGLARRRAALDKRFQRAREAVLAEVEVMREEGLIDAALYAALGVQIQAELYLQKRKDSLLASRTRDATRRSSARLSGGFTLS